MKQSRRTEVQHTGTLKEKETGVSSAVRAAKIVSATQALANASCGFAVWQSARPNV